jgi:hypothetical protein
MNLPKCEVNLIPALFMLLSMFCFNYAFKLLERKIHKFKYYKDPYIVKVQVPTEKMIVPDSEDVQYMSARPHAYVNYSYDEEDQDDEPLKDKDSEDEEIDLKQKPTNLANDKSSKISMSVVSKVKSRSRA